MRTAQRAGKDGSLRLTYIQKRGSLIATTKSKFKKCNTETCLSTADRKFLYFDAIRETVV